MFKIIFGCFITFDLIAFILRDFAEANTSWMKISVVKTVFLILIGSTLFSILLYKMKTKHNYEYKLAKNQMIIYFMAQICSYIILCLVWYGFAEHHHNSMNSNPKDLLNHCLERAKSHLDEPFKAFLDRTLKISIAFEYIIPFIDLLIVATIIVLKSPVDCLQGINKLDYLLKASWF